MKVLFAKGLLNLSLKFKIRIKMKKMFDLVRKKWTAFLPSLWEDEKIHAPLLPAHDTSTS